MQMRRDALPGRRWSGSWAGWRVSWSGGRAIRHAAEAHEIVLGELGGMAIRFNGVAAPKAANPALTNGPCHHHKIRIIYGRSC